MNASVVVVANTPFELSVTLASLAQAHAVGEVIVVPWQVEPEVLRRAAGGGTVPVVSERALERGYDAAALGALFAREEVLVFALAGVSFGTDSVAALVRACADPAVGIVAPLVVDQARRVLEAGWQTGDGAGITLAARFAGQPLESPGVLEPAEVGAARLRCMALLRDRYRFEDGLAPRLGAAFADLDLALRLRRAGLSVRYAPDAAVVDVNPVRPQLDDPKGPSAEAFARAWPALPPPPPVPPEPKLGSIVMLSWNATEYTRRALDSIRAHTRPPYEVIVVDNGSGPETRAWLRTLDDVRVIYNEHNTGFAHGCNQGMAAARGEYVVLLNNDVIVTAHWLEDLVDALERDPAIGVAAVRSNIVAGAQQIDVTYTDVGQMHHFAAQRRRSFFRRGYFTDRAIGLCLCIRRSVIETVGGIDERFGVGNFEDDDFCLRVRAAGFKIFVCDGVFVHHFGSATFRENNVDWGATMAGNWEKFAAKWALPEEYPVRGYDPRPAIARGFDPELHYQPLPAGENPVPEAPSAEASFRPLRLVAVVRSERDWNEIAAVVRRFASAVGPELDVAFEIAALGQPDAAILGSRVERTLEKIGLNPQAIADVTIEDVAALDAWLAQVAAHSGALVRVQRRPPQELDSLPLVEDTSPSGLRRFVGTLATP